MTEVFDPTPAPDPRWTEEFGEDLYLLGCTQYGEFTVTFRGQLLPATFSLEELVDVERLIVKVKALLQEVTA